ncbi:hypothetical protein TIFTF001_044188 [Ficus carica]|uniref:Uncharacterized protein n=1 Tax=Ficus carica TaxID=3494 RepID=A0AA87Z1B9_FICCA|nr:hypothetical protein TIFTF001_044188 [Ficus carica]
MGRKVKRKESSPPSDEGLDVGHRVEDQRIAITILGLIILGVMIGDVIRATAIVISASRRFSLGFSAAMIADYCM